jgi:lysophospholipase L1-like esterase
MRVESTSGSSFNFFARTSQTGVSGAYIFDQASPPTSSTWTGGSYSTAPGAVTPVELYMQAPQAVFIGDSIISGHNANLSFLHTTETTNIASTIEKQFSNLTGYTYQNMGVGAQTTSQIEARFTADVINLHPRIVVIEGGVNDIAQSVAKATFLAKWTSMLDAAQASDSISKILVMKILPWSNGTNVQMQTRDDWNASLVTLAAGYSKAIVVDASSYVGQFRSGGDAGNLWDIQAVYNSDGVHFTSAGHGQIAQALADNLPSTATTITSFNFASPSVTGTVDNTAHTVALTVPFGTTVTNLTPTIALATGATISPTSGSAQDFISPVTYTVTAQDGMTSQTYAVTVTVAANTSTSITSFNFTSPSVTGTVDNTAHTVALTVPFGTTVTSLTPTIVLATGATISPNTGVAGNFSSPVAYTVTAQDGTTNQAYTATVTVALNTAKALTAFDFNALTPAVVGSVNEGAKTVTLTVPFGTVLTNLVPTITINGSSVSPVSGIAHTFVDGVSTNYTVTAADSSTQIYAVTVNVAANTAKTITASSGANGSISPSGSVSVNNGSDQAFTITADSGYHISDVLVDGSSVGAVSSYTFSSVTTDHTISATFARTSSGGGGCYNCYVNPSVPSGGFKISINGGASTTPSRNVFLGFNAGVDIKKMAISMTGDFIDASQENYTTSKQWDLCSKLGGLIKNPTCPDGKYTIYAKFYTAWGRTSDSALASSTIVLKSGSTTTENLQQYTNLPFTNPFTKYLQYRQTNADIKRLQIFLNADPDTKIADTGAGSPSKETNYFGLLTYKAVIKFQEKYAKDILDPWGFKKGTGYVGKTTLAKINELMKNK